MRARLLCKQVFSACGAIAQLGERFHGMEEVVGSIPSGSTKLLLCVEQRNRLRWRSLNPGVILINVLARGICCAAKSVLR